MHTPAQLPSVTRPRTRWGERRVFAFVALLVLAVIAVWGVEHVGYAVGKEWAESPAGQRTASRGLGKAIKVDGTFAPLQVDGWTIRTGSFTSKGWPGEAIGSIDAWGIRAGLDPSAVWKGAYRISGIQIDRAKITLVPPNDKLKRPTPPKKPRPWYAAFLPSRVECGPIVSPNADLLYYFQGKSAQITGAHVQADLVGKDMKYTATSGTLEMPYLPTLHINRLEMLVTRPMIRVYTAQLAGLNNDPARVTLSGTIGMRENKAIEASGEIVDVPIDQILPEDLSPLIHGRATGKLTWKRDSTGKILDSDGRLALSGATIDDLSIFKQLALLHGNADLTNFSFDTAAVEFHVHGGHAELVLRAHAPNKLTLEGHVAYELDSKRAQVDLAVTELPLQTWLPTEFKPGAAGMAQAHLQWQGQLKTIRDSSGHVTISLNDGRLATPAVLRRVLARKKLRAPDIIQFKTAEMDLHYQDQTFQLTRGDFDLPGILTARVDGTLQPDNLLHAQVDWHGLTVQDWLPQNLADEFSGDIEGQAQFEVQKWKLGDGSYAGQIRLVHGELRYTPFQVLLARFMNDRGLLDLPLTQATFLWTWKNGELRVSNLDLRGRDALDVRGDFVVRRDKQLSGTLWVGTRPDYVAKLSGLGGAVFFRPEDGLKWAKVRLSGTARKPVQDLTGQLIAQAKKRPLGVLALGFKAVSWFVGNWFGADKQWQRPDTQLP